MPEAVADYSKFKSIAFRAFDAVIWCFVLIGLLWTVGAIYFLPVGPNWITVSLVVVFVATLIVAGYYCGSRNVFRAIIAAAVVAVYFATLQILPSNERNWDPDHARVAQIEIEDGQVEIRNFRNNFYRSELDYDARYKPNDSI